MTVLIPGATGFIGVHLSRRLLEQGTAVVGFDNVNPYDDRASSGAGSPRCRPPRPRRAPPSSCRGGRLQSHDALSHARAFQTDLRWLD